MVVHGHPTSAAGSVVLASCGCTLLVPLSICLPQSVPCLLLPGAMPWCVSLPWPAVSLSIAHFAAAFLPLSLCAGQEGAPVTPTPHQLSTEPLLWCTCLSAGWAPGLPPVGWLPCPHCPASPIPCGWRDGCQGCVTAISGVALAGCGLAGGPWPGS